MLTSFSGVKHRLQYLGELAGRKVYNDSKATNILATEKALSGFENSRLWLLAGGLDRGNGFEDLADSVIGIKGMVLLGRLHQSCKSLLIACRFQHSTVKMSQQLLKQFLIRRKRGHYFT